MLGYTSPHVAANECRRAAAGDRDAAARYSASSKRRETRELAADDRRRCRESIASARENDRLARLADARAATEARRAARRSVAA